MKTLKLKTIHRLLILTMLEEEGKSGGSLSEVNRLLKMIDRVDFSEQERKDLNIRMEDSKVKWNARKDGSPEGEEVDLEKDFELLDEQVEKLKDIFKKRDEAKKFTTVDASPVFEIAGQIGYGF